MILGFLGKGGSGKSSVATQMAFWLCDQARSVLAIDADHNMDLSFNLAGGELPEMSYLSQSQAALDKATGLEVGEKYAEAFLRDTGKRFRLSPLSVEIERYSALLPNNIRLMTAGPQTDEVLYGQACSHVLTTPLKLLLPLLELNDKEDVVVDEKAGADGVSTGIVSGIDVGVIVCEPALHSVKTAKQIAELMRFYGTPYVFVGNKIASSEDRDFVTEYLSETPAAFLLMSDGVKRDPSATVGEWQDEMKSIYEAASLLNKNDRLARTVSKFERNQEFAHQD